MYDVIIIGGGAAAMSAAIYAARRQMKTLMIAKDLGGQMMWASVIENYPGYKSITASELIEKFTEQVRELGVEIKISEVKEIKKLADENFAVATASEKFSAKTVIVAIGAAHRQLGVPGEKELAGRGVAYCANCDGPLFRDKTVAVVGGGNSALDAAGLLAKIAKKVYLIHQFDTFQAFEHLEKKIREAANIEIILQSKVEEIIGEKKVTSIKIRNLADDSSREISLDGIFVEIGFEVKTDLVANLVKINERKEIIVNEKYETSLPGMFAAGDCTNGPFKQIVISAGNGSIAALSAYNYIQLKEGNIKKITK
ncbi:MAG TPA: FAD-dependent oxidoreductase [Candidatus Methylomirabilis sp.]|nr:FAD-dependent oxidoreductase [Candidatus Methylomirabilis sp.]